MHMVGRERQTEDLAGYLRDALARRDACYAMGAGACGWRIRLPRYRGKEYSAPRDHVASSRFDSRDATILASAIA